MTPQAHLNRAENEWQRTVRHLVGALARRRRRGELHRPGRAPGIQLVELERDAVGSEESDRMVELRQPVAALAVRANSQKGGSPQDVLYESGKIAPRAKLHEEAYPVRV
jgi:hypothetical protein